MAIKNIPDLVAAAALAGTNLVPISQGSDIPVKAEMSALLAYVKAGGVYHDGNILGTVSQSGGVPTGAVIERGSNANGEYVRFADGLQICTHTVTTSSTANTTWTYPAVFTANPTYAGVVESTVVDAAFVISASGTTTSASINAIDPAGARAASNTDLTAFGRWF